MFILACMGRYVCSFSLVWVGMCVHSLAEFRPGRWVMHEDLLICAKEIFMHYPRKGFMS